MIDKQIIIEGCDVSGCKCIIEDYQRANNFEGKYEHIKNVCELGERGAEYYNLFCKDNPNCNYKQLKRAEQLIVELNKTIQAKEQECEKLKLDLIEAKAHRDYLNNLALSKTLDTVSEQLDQLKKQNDIMLNSLKKLQNKICSNTSQCKYFLMDVLKEVENASK